MTPLGVSFHLLIEHQGLVLSAILVPFDSNWFMLCPWDISFFQKFAPCPFPSCYTRTGLTSLLLQSPWSRALCSPVLRKDPFQHVWPQSTSLPVERKPGPGLRCGGDQDMSQDSWPGLVNQQFLNKHSRLWSWASSSRSVGSPLPWAVPPSCQPGHL